MSTDATKFILILSILLVRSFCSSAQRDKIALGLRSTFEHATLATDSVYLVDSMPSKIDFDYNELRPEIPGSDSLLLKAILDSGKKVALRSAEIQQMLLPHRVGIVSEATYYSVRVPPLAFTPNEWAIRRRVDSLIHYATEPGLDSAKVKSAWTEVNRVMDDTLFRSSLIKIERSRKRLVFVPPLLIYNNHVLLVMVFFNSITNSFEKARIIDLSR